ncbi:MAG: nucleotidyltransferase [Lachnospiraceae bacterium]|nr:nucleotidyltransferase [Lachnospiraceae bacterium]
MSKEPVLVVMAAGIGSRYGEGIKQLAHVGPSGEAIIDYSVYDAIEAGFKKVIFIIRHDIEEDFRQIVGNHLEGHIDIQYAFQELDDLPEGFALPEDRRKPWGTGQAILACRDLLDGPFAVINADDYYGKECYRLVYDYLKNGLAPGHLGMVSFVIKNTLSDHGTVTRGICKVDPSGSLTGVEETKEIRRCEDGVIRGIYNGNTVTIGDDDLVSMNLWGLGAEFMDELKTRFVKFLSEVPEGDVKSEYLLPIIVDDMLHEGKACVDVMTSHDTWFGITYAEDKPLVTDYIHEYVRRGIYPEKLF